MLTVVILPAGIQTAIHNQSVVAGDSTKLKGDRSSDSILTYLGTSFQQPPTTMGTVEGSRAPAVVGVTTAALVISLITTTLRCFVRICLVKAFGSDDWLMVGATVRYRVCILCPCSSVSFIQSPRVILTFIQVSFILYSSFSLAGVRYGTGQHMQNLQPEDASKALKVSYNQTSTLAPSREVQSFADRDVGWPQWWWLCYLTYSATMLLAKLSIAWFLLRVAVKPVHKWIIYIGMTLTVVGSMAFFFACIFQCWPVSYFWDRSQEGSCTENGVVLALSYVFSTINIVSDFIFALLPAWIVSHLNMKLKTKVALIGLMGMGCV